MSKHKVLVFDEKECPVMDYEDFICPNCEAEKVNKDYKINRRSLIWSLLALAIAFLLGWTKDFWFV